MISNDVYLAGSDGWELYKRAPLPSPLLGALWVRGALASAPAGGDVLPYPPSAALVPPKGGGNRVAAPAPGSLCTPLRCSRPRRN